MGLLTTVEDKLIHLDFFDLDLGTGVLSTETGVWTFGIATFILFPFCARSEKSRARG